MTMRAIKSAGKPFRQLPRVEQQRLCELVRLENAFLDQGFLKIAGLDEAGRGPLAGPVVAAACVISGSVVFPGVKDSKQLSREQREELFALLITSPYVQYAWGIVPEDVIDKINILQATKLAMQQAVLQLEGIELLLIDALSIDVPIKQESLIRGEEKSQSIAAASILAKVKRDEIMTAYDKEFPGYGFCKHKGYATEVHLKALQELGPCPIHRRSFHPMKERKKV